MNRPDKQIIAMGGGGFSMEPDNPLLDQYILGLVKKKLPKICFVPTASGDQDNYIERFYRFFRQHPCSPTHLSLFDANFENLEEFIMEQDIIYVGGGSTRNMLVLWKEWGLDNILKKAYHGGIILAGLSAGAICWFEEGVTDPKNGELYPINGLGFLEGSVCPHYDGENKRRPAFHKLINEQKIQNGYAIQDSVALHFMDGTLYKSICSKEQKTAYIVKKESDFVMETPVNTVYLGDK